MYRRVIFYLMLFILAGGSVSHAGKAMAAAPNTGVFYKGPLVTDATLKSRACPNPLLPDETGCFFNVKWAQVEPQQGVYDWTIIDRQFDGSTYPMQINVLGGLANAPNSDAVCQSYTAEPGAPPCKPWLRKFEGIVAHLRSHGQNGEPGPGGGTTVGNIPPCAEVYSNYPGDPGYQRQFSQFIRTFYQHYKDNPRVASVGFYAVSEIGHNLSMPVRLDHQLCPDGSYLSEYYNDAWNAVAMKHGCASHDNNCWRDLVANATNAIWLSEVKILRGFNVTRWVTSGAFPSVKTSTGEADRATDSGSMQYRILAYSKANQPPGGQVWFSNEAMQDGLQWSSAVSQWLFGDPRVRGGSQMIGVIGDCAKLCRAMINCGTNKGTEYFQPYLPDVKQCPEVIHQVVLELSGTPQTCPGPATCP